MHSDDAELNLLLSHFDDDAPVLEAGLPRDVAADHDHGDSGVTAESFYNLGAAGNDVGEQGWCVIAPEGDRGDALLGRIKPLVDARRELLGEEPRVYRVPPKMTADAAMKWRAEVYNVGDPDYIPRYQLLLGDLHEVPLELQQAQASEGYVGRLAFANDEDYNAYAEKVLAWERAPSAREDAESVFYTVHDGTAATRAGYRSLVAPVLTKTKEMQGRGRFQAGSIREIGDVDEPAPGELLDAAADLEAGVLFTMSHGAGAPRRGWSSVEAQRAGQGAMSFGREGHLAGSEIAGKPFAAGGVWFMFACFGAGTPDRSKFHHWLEQLSSVGQFRGRTEAVLKSLPKGVSQERPFIAALPQAALASPRGPLAFIGHLDLAWTYSFLEIADGKQQSRTDKFYNILKSLHRGDRVGVSLHELVRFYTDKNQELTEIYDRAQADRAAGRAVELDRARLGHLWMVRQDLSGYILLGDPAVRLPLAKRGPAKRPVQKAIEIETPIAQAAEPASEGASFAAQEIEAPTLEPAAPREDASAPDDAPAQAIDGDAPESDDAPAQTTDGDAPESDDAPARPPSKTPAEPEIVVEVETTGPRPTRAGEVGGEVTIDGDSDGATTIRWRVRWRLDD